jgi:hypothetical protein
MRNHNDHVAANAQGQPLDEFLDTPEPVTPRKESPTTPPVEHRPSVPLKKDDSVIYSQCIRNALLTYMNSRSTRRKCAR